MQIGRFVWTARVFAVVATMALLTGCGGSAPEPEPDISDMDPMDEPVVTSEEDNPPPRDETPVWVDPNSEYANILVNIHFEFNRYRILEADKPKLEKIANLLKNNSNFKLMIEGHCDERGTNEYNMGLGEQRAQSTKRYLTSLGVTASRFTTVSFGEERPLDPGHNEAAWAKNRRCQFRVEAPRS